MLKRIITTLWLGLTSWKVMDVSWDWLSAFWWLYRGGHNATGPHHFLLHPWDDHRGLADRKEVEASMSAQVSHDHLLPQKKEKRQKCFYCKALVKKPLCYEPRSDTEFCNLEDALFLMMESTASVTWSNTSFCLSSSSSFLKLGAYLLEMFSFARDKSPTWTGLNRERPLS